MGEIDDGLARAERTRPIPSTVPARLRHLLRAAKGSTKILASDLGVSQRTVQRWIKGAAVPRPVAAADIEARVRASWQPRVRERVRRRAEAQGFVLHVQGRFGYSAAGGSTDDPRERIITQHLPGQVARELYVARDAGAGEAEQQRILAGALQEHYFRDRGRRAEGLSVRLDQLGWADFGV
ncbi:XRE family transcriptional regulator [Kitasatospora cineracea]|uniref:telomere-protecting terminal protein Tpg n=1 Tax=Kitasatospora cineracea TaxID=88074 RepID=UPI00343EE5B2